MFGRPQSGLPNELDDDLAEALEFRDELLIACRDVLLRVGTREAAWLVAHIHALLDLDDEGVARIAALNNSVWIRLRALGSDSLVLGRGRRRLIFNPRLYATSGELRQARRATCHWTNSFLR